MSHSNDIGNNKGFIAVLMPVMEKAGLAPCLILPNGESVSYQKMVELVCLICANLHHQGVKAGDRVLVQAAKTPELVALYLATLRIGGIYVPLNEAYTVNELNYFLDDAQPALFVSESGHDAVALAELLQTGFQDPGMCLRSADDPAAIVYTSGTTGRSKGAVLTHNNLLSNAQSLSELWGWQSTDVLLHALPIFHVHGLFVALHCALLNGTPMIFLPKFDVELLIAHLPQATVMMGVPTFYTRLLADERFDSDLCRSMRLFISGSAPLAEQTSTQFQDRIGHDILERYGMSETLMIASNPLEGSRLPGTVGYALPDVHIRIRNEEGELAPINAVGEIEVQGPNVMLEYWQMPEKTAAEFTTDGYLKTGDVGLLDETGRLSLVGRSKDLIISGGYNVYPKEIEVVLDALPGVVDSAVVGVPHPDFGEGVVAVLVSDEPIDVAKIKAVLSNSLARFKQPKQYFQMPELPRNAMGKVQKAVLREAYADVFK